jgi:hypothetical protein
VLAVDTGLVAVRPSALGDAVPTGMEIRLDFGIRSSQDLLRALAVAIFRL